MSKTIYFLQINQFQEFEQIIVFFEKLFCTSREFPLLAVFERRVPRHLKSSQKCESIYVEVYAYWLGHDIRIIMKEAKVGLVDSYLLHIILNSLTPDSGGRGREVGVGHIPSSFTLFPIHMSVIDRPMSGCSVHPHNQITITAPLHMCGVNTVNWQLGVMTTPYFFVLQSQTLLKAIGT